MDNEKYYVIGALNEKFQKWSGSRLQGNMMMIVITQDARHECYVLVASKLSDALPDNYSQVSDEGLITPPDETEEANIIAVRLPSHPPQRF